MKIIFFDKNKELCKLAKSIPEIKVINGDLSEIEADAISTASNPAFTFAGGLDSELNKRFNLKRKSWLDIQKGDDKIKNVVLNITVNRDLSTSKKLIRKAYINFFNLAHNKKWETIAVSGFGSGVGKLPISTVIEALREAVDMYLTIVGKKNVELIDINNLVLVDCNSAKLTNCDSTKLTNCHFAKLTNCYSTNLTYCNSTIILYSNDCQADNCYLSDKHKSKIEITNPRKKSEFKKIFLERFKKGNKYIAYKFLTKDWESPISDTKIKYNKGETYSAEVNKKIEEDCGKGINLATLNWCKINNKCDGIYVKFEFNPRNATVPTRTDGKFRVSKCKCLGEIRIN